MPIAQWLILKFPSWILGLVFVGGLVLLSVMGLLTMRRLLPHHTRLREHHDVAGPILGVLGAVYAVLLAFVVVTVWQNLDKTHANVQMEANYLADIYRDAEAFPADFRQKVADLTREYRQAVVASEWKAMARGEMSPEVEALMNRIWGLYTHYEPQTSKERSFFDESVRKLNSFRELRRQRLMDARAGLPLLLWTILVTGMFATLALTFLFGMENLKFQVLMVALLSLTIALILFTILLLDFPFTGDVSVSAEPFTRLLLN